MKRVTKLLTAGLLLITALNASAQVKYGKGDVLLNLGLGFGYYYASGVPAVASVEFLINDAISIGPYLGFTAYSRNLGGYKYSYTFFDFGARGEYHFSKHLNLRTDKLDLYGGILLGYVVSNYSVDGTIVGYDDPYASAVRFGALGGARYYFSPKFGVNAEVGAGGLAPVLAGITFKF